MRSTQSLTFLVAVLGATVSPARADVGDWTKLIFTPFQPIAVANVLLTGCIFGYQTSDAEQRYSGQMACQAANTPDLGQDRDVILEFMFDDTTTHQPAFAETIYVTLPANGTSVPAVANNGHNYYNPLTRHPQPDMSSVRLRVTIRTAVSSGLERLVQTRHP